MKRLMRSLRVRLAVTGFLTAYAPTLVLLLVAFALSGTVDTTVNETSDIGGIVETETIQRTGLPLWVVVVVALGFAPFAAMFAWWWSGRALRPLAEAIGLQERLIEETSHELRTPLAVLSNNAEVLLAHPEPTIDVYRQGLERSGVVANRMSETIDSLLVDARGRARTIDRVPTDLVALAAAAIDSVTPLAVERGVTVSLDGPKRLDAAVDPPSVSRAITNLVTNAVQHGPPGSTVHIDLAAEPGGAAVVQVTDEGPGIPPDDQAKIFERYWHDEVSGGSGIGLTIVKQVAAAHGGTITVTSPVGDRPGCRFRFTMSV